MLLELVVTEQCSWSEIDAHCSGNGCDTSPLHKTPTGSVRTEVDLADTGSAKADVSARPANRQPTTRVMVSATAEIGQRTLRFGNTGAGAAMVMAPFGSST